jgi:hypothetical protein
MKHVVIAGVLVALAGCPSDEPLTLHLAPDMVETQVKLQTEPHRPF